METTTAPTIPTFEVGQEIVHRLQSTRNVFWTVTNIIPEGLIVKGIVGKDIETHAFIRTSGIEMYEIR